MNTRRGGGTVPVILFLAVVAIAVAIGVQTYQGRQNQSQGAATAGGTADSELFSHSMTLDEARKVAESEGKPVLVFATADWCGPCQMLKKNTFTDPQVAAKIREKTVPIYFDVTDANTAPPEASQLGIQGIPALIAMENGKEISRSVGYKDSAELLRWLNSL